MATIEISADEIFRRNLLHLSNETKRRLIELLASSLTFTSTPPIDVTRQKILLDRINGAWSDDELTAEEEIKLLREART